MKNKFKMSSIVIVALCGTLHVSGQPSPNADANNTPANSGSTVTGNANTTTSGKAGTEWRNGNATAAADMNARYHLGKLERADKIIGREIRDAQDQKIGKVKDLAVDLQNGRIVEVIVGTGGMLGIEEKFVAVPPGEFACDPVSKTVMLNVDKAKFTEAPSFKLSEWRNGHADITQVYQYYGIRPYFTSAELTDQNRNTVNRPGEVERADKVIGTTVHNTQNERLGRVTDLIVDLRGGRVVEVILASGGFLGMGDEHSAVPPQAFHLGTEPDTLVLDTTKDALANAPHFKSSEWPDFNNSEQVTAVYHAYNVEPNFTAAAADNTAQNTGDRSRGTLTPLNQGTSDSDMEITRQIRKQIMADDTLSVNAHNVKVITVNGKVALRGTVNNQDEKRKIDDIATKVATPGNVDDQIQVENRTSSTQ